MTPMASGFRPGSTTYTWNAAAELLSVTKGSSVTTYTYDGDGKRISATTGSTTTTYSYNVNGVLPALALESNGSGAGASDRLLLD